MSDRAVALNPNLASVWLVRGWINSMSGNFEEAMNSFARVLQFSELDPARIGACCGISYGCFQLGKYEEGCAWAEKALQKYENALYRIPLIANAVGATREDKARNAVARLLKVAPNFRVSRIGEYIRRRSSLESLAKALREAGLPE